MPSTRWRAFYEDDDRYRPVDTRGIVWEPETACLTIMTKVIITPSWLWEYLNDRLNSFGQMRLIIWYRGMPPILPEPARPLAWENAGRSFAPVVPLAPATRPCMYAKYAYNKHHFIKTPRQKAKLMKETAKRKPHGRLTQSVISTPKRTAVYDRDQRRKKRPSTQARRHPWHLSKMLKSTANIRSGISTSF